MKLSAWGSHTWDTQHPRHPGDVLHLGYPSLGHPSIKIPTSWGTSLLGIPIPGAPILWAPIPWSDPRSPKIPTNSGCPSPIPRHTIIWGIHRPGHSAPGMSISRPRDTTGRTLGGFPPCRAVYSSSSMRRARPKSAILHTRLSPTRMLAARRSRWM